MAEKQNPATSEKPKSAPSERDEPVKIDLDPEEALRALLQVDPDAPPVEPIEERPSAPKQPEK